MEYKVIFTEDLKGDKKTYTGLYRGSSVGRLAENVVKEYLDELCRWVSYIGNIDICLLDMSTGRTIAEGCLNINCFSGKDKIRLRVWQLSHN